MQSQDGDAVWLSLRQLARRRIVPVGYFTLWKWARRGAKMPWGEVRMLSVREVNGRLYCTEAELRRFVREATPNAGG